MCEQASPFIFCKIGFRDIYCMITAGMKLAGISGGYLLQAPHIKYNHTELFVWDHVKTWFLSPRLETPQPSWATPASAGTPSQ